MSARHVRVLGALRRAPFVAAVLFAAACTASPDTPDGPQVVSTSPPDQATDVNPDTALRITFDRDIDPATLGDGALVVTPDISGSFTWDPIARTAIFRPGVVMLEATRYEVEVTTAITDVDGNPLRGPARFSFTTRGVPNTGTNTYTHGDDTATVAIDDRDSDTRTYTLTTTADLRDNNPPDRRVVFTERPGQMILRSGHDIFDALWAMAVDESRQLSVSAISDGAFGGGAPIPCDCFETGEQWKYVWTRDTAYAAQLGLALLDPARTRDSLSFKLSARKPSAGGGDVQIVQDTGSGGSYPVSTDRVVWALGARETLAFLAGGERQAFADAVFDAIVNTIEQDRVMVYDPADGLYRGEQSFLDWREQSYPTWTAQDTVHLAMAKALSTNVGHHAILTLAADLAAERGDAAAEARYRGFADDLAAAIRAELWLDDAGMYATLKHTALDAAALHKFDLLGSSLAVLEGVASAAEAAESVARYPRSEIGPPVIWPQQPLIPIYHNRGMWPFVTAYAILAARHTGNAAVVSRDVESMVRGAALNLSNMENFDFLTGANFTDDGPYSGPVVNSRRQLWSVAGYVAMVAKGIFGLEVQSSAAGGIRFRPFVTRTVRRRFFGEVDTVRLANIPYRGKLIDVELLLPADPSLGDPQAPDGAYEIGQVFLDGAAVGAGFVNPADLGAHSAITVTLMASVGAAGEVHVVADDGDFRRFWAPREPSITNVAPAPTGGLNIAFDGGGDSGVVYHVYRDGQLLAEAITETSFTDDSAADHATRTYCYAIEAEFSLSGNRSHHSPPVCYWGPALARIQEVDATAFAAVGGSFSEQYGRPHYQDWGEATDTLEIASFQPSQSGAHYIQLIYGNGAGPVSTGVTAAVKWVVIEDAASGAVVTEGPAVMPQRGDWAIWAESSLLTATLDAARTYRVIIRDGINMSYFDHFVSYVGSGGGASPFNFVNVTAVKFLAR